jgi:hypothetical protein
MFGLFRPQYNLNEKKPCKNVDDKETNENRSKMDYFRRMFFSTHLQTVIYDEICKRF